MSAVFPTFICDDNLGKLARYLRLGGYDTHFDSTIEDKKLIRIALDESRIVLSRDRKLAENNLVRKFLLITEDLWPAQLRQVQEKFAVLFVRSRMLTRCLVDNTETVIIARESIKDRVYPYTYEHFTEFRECPVCHRVYWAGTHVGAMLKRLTENGFAVSDDPG